MSAGLRQLLGSIDQCPGVNRFLVAFSGGLDSTVLLHLAAQHLRNRRGTELRALHVHHGLHGDADQWARHCRSICEAMGVAIEVFRADVTSATGSSPEAEARRARYRQLELAMQPNDALLMAHHADDQAETMLMRLARGAGVSGLAGIPPRRPLGPGMLVRPLLAAARNALRDYADTHRLNYLSDPANADMRFDRNYLRREIMPRLKARWPATPASAVRSAGHLAEAARLLAVLAEGDLRSAGDDGGALRVSRLRRLPPDRLHNLLRHWIARHAFRAPSSAKLEVLVHEVIGAGEDAEPRVEWDGAEVRRYRDQLFIMPPLPEAPGDWECDWNLRGSLALPAGLGRLRAEPAVGRGLRAAATVTIRFRRGGERLKPAGRSHHRELRKLFQEHAVAPWIRDRMPLVYAGEALAAVADLWIADQFAAIGDQPGTLLAWDAGALA